MDVPDDVASSYSKPGFFKYMFSFDSEMKGEMLNLAQYTSLSLIPVIVLNKIVQKWVPEADENKGSVEIVIEVLLQVLVMFLGLYFVNRMVMYVPTYSGLKYPSNSTIYVILAVLMITLSLQTKLGEKVSLLVERLQDFWEGKKDDEKDANNKGKKRGNKGKQASMTQQQSQALYSDSTSIQQLPILGGAGMGTQKQPDFNSMYRNDSNPMVGAATPQADIYGGFNEPMPANMALGSAFNSW